MYEGLLNDLRKVNLQQILSWIDEAVRNNETKIINMARNRMKSGQGVSGGVIGYYRSLSYELFKRRENPLAKGNVDLFLTGELQSKMRISSLGYGSYFIYSTDEKYTLLADKYGANQFGLTEEQHDEVIGIVVNYVIDKINKYYE